MGKRSSNEVETVLFPLVAIDQAVLVEAVVAVKKRDERAWYVFSCINDHDTQGHDADCDGQLRHAAGFHPAAEQGDAAIGPPADRGAGNRQGVAEPVHHVAQGEPQQLALPVPQEGRKGRQQLRYG